MRNMCFWNLIESINYGFILIERLPALIIIIKILLLALRYLELSQLLQF